MTTTWNPADKAANMTLSNGDLLRGDKYIDAIDPFPPVK